MQSIPKGIVLDTRVLIAGERRKESLERVLWPIRQAYGELAIGLSTISVIELTHGIYRASIDSNRLRRLAFVDEILNDLDIYPVSIEIAQLSGRIEGEQAPMGIAIPFQDLVIGSTALHLGFDVATHNTKHFQLIPNLKILGP